MLNIIYEDKDIIIVNKPSGQLSQSGKSFDLDLVSEVLNYRKAKKEEAYAAIINRLDRPVSGLVLIAKNRASAAKYSGISTYNKQYVALVCGKLEENKGEFVDYLEKDEKNNESFVVKEAPSDNESTKHKCRAKLARLTYEVEEYDKANDISRVRINLITGRHHQIRVQFSSRGNVIVGDYKYIKNTSMNTTDMDNKVRFIGLKRNQIALSAVSIDVDKKTYKVKEAF